ncbi:MAG: hypothetical protein NTX03_02710 [Bacteroidetes bacterium]|nr:hypothetical protein [Bacteroidota bacterium]
MISKNFTINYQPFADWFNTNIFGKFPFFANRINPTNFDTVLKNVALLVGKSEMNLNEFIGHFCIIYNETGGRFQPMRELGGQAYMFNKIMPNGQSKYSYNLAPNNRLAGDQLKAWGIISSVADVQLWNEQAYPDAAPLAVKTAANKCDFYRYRGYGFNQLTWHSNYLICLQPHIPKPMDNYSVEEFETALQDFTLAAKAFNTFNSRNASAIAAVNALASGNFAPYAKLVSGGAKWYMDLYTNRFTKLSEKLNGLTIRPMVMDFNPATLTRDKVIKIQQTVLDGTNADAAHHLAIHGGADGAWGGNTSIAFEMAGKALKEYEV